jgi:hypothetical protein
MMFPKADIGLCRARGFSGNDPMAVVEDVQYRAHILLKDEFAKGIIGWATAVEVRRHPNQSANITAL